MNIAGRTVIAGRRFDSFFCCCRRDEVVGFGLPYLTDEMNLQLVGDGLFRLVDELGRRKILVSFRHVLAVTSAAMGKFDTLRRKLRAVSGELVLCSMSPEVAKSFALAAPHLEVQFTITPNEQTGLQSFH